MSHIRVLICRVDDPATEQMTEVAAFDLPTPDVAILKPTTTLDDLETVTQRTGTADFPWLAVSITALVSLLCGGLARHVVRRRD